MEQARVIIGINSDNFRGLYPNAQKNQYTLPLDRVTKGRGFVEKLNFGLFFFGSHEHGSCYASAEQITYL